MKRSIHYAAILTGLVLLAQCTLKDKPAMTIVPKPAHFEMLDKGFTLAGNPGIRISGEDLGDIRDYLVAELKSVFNIDIRLDGDNPMIDLAINPQLPDSLGDEGYVLKTGMDGVKIEARSKAGLFYGIQTLLQITGTDGYVDGVAITDAPRFEWRGFMLDVSRHFFPMEYVLKVIDNMAMHKLNTLQLHLTDDQGWRIEIKKYPKLTETGAWRVDREDQHWNAREKQKPGEKATYGGFYTQDEIREIVAYAQSRFITVVPEIEMPGHTTAALAAYPEYSCTGGPFTVLPGGIWPITDIYCAGKDETFEFLEDILAEVLELFPAEYIHIGGDEANKKEWEVCPDCQKRIKDEGLENEHELQSYFITRIEKYLNSQGRQLIGWDEILEGGLAPNAAVMSWRGMEGGITAAKSGHPVVMSPTSHCYFDYYQGKPELEPLAIGGLLPLQKVYSFNPVPEGLTPVEAKYIKGVQANLWTEYISTPEHADYMTFPRLSALAEVAWTPQGKREFTDFAERLRAHLKRLDNKGIKYSRSFANVDLQTEFNPEKREFLIQLSNPLGYGEIRYTLDGSDPGQNSMIYTEPFTLGQTTLVKAVTYTDGSPYSGIASEKVWIHKATGAEVSYNSVFSDSYPAGGENALTNSLRGSVNLGDGRWQGFNENNLDVIVDLGQETEILKISLGCLQTVGSWVFFPENVTFLASQDGENFSEIGKAHNQLSPRDPDRKIQDFALENLDLQTRYIKVIAKNIGKCPDWHSAAGEPAWLFADEIIVE